MCGGGDGLSKIARAHTHQARVIHFSLCRSVHTVKRLFLRGEDGGTGLPRAPCPESLLDKALVARALSSRSPVNKSLCHVERSRVRQSGGRRAPHAERVKPAQLEEIGRPG